MPGAAAPGECYPTPPMPSRPPAFHLLLVAIVCAIPWATPHAHIGPSTRENNRYLKLTLYGNRARLLYTVYLGQQPGRQARLRMDADGNGAIDEAEARAFGRELGATVAANLELRVDGAPVAARWATTDVGLGVAAVDAGAFSVDLVQWLCLPTAAGVRDHRLTLYDHWQPPRAGEAELRVEPTAGVTVVQSKLGADNPSSQLRFKWVESHPPHPLDRDGLHVELQVDPERADMSAHEACAPTGAHGASAPASDADAATTTAPPRRDEGRARRWRLVAWLAAAALVLGALFAIGRRRGSSR